ncbi:MAG: relaxase/mobilization nuclease domain-containing protein [Alphaproteobacteria bacterium]|nr:relaxase/mobilization nuclease domain-containing protein [Alphaproteobacteria bacterium]
MAVFKIVNTVGKYHDAEARDDVVNYILRSDKVKSGYAGVCALDPFVDIVVQMEETSESFAKDKGVRLRHWVISFDTKEVTNPSIVNEIALKVAMVIGANFQTVYAVHEDKFYLHFHLVYNAVSYVDGHRFYGTRADFYEFSNLLKTVCTQYGIRTVIYSKKK